MATNQQDSGLERTAYRACESLPIHYAAIGAALQLNQPNNFRHQVAFVPTEALESYLDDLLDTEVSIAVLCLAGPSMRAAIFGVVLSVLSLAAGLIVTTYGGGFELALLVTGILACPGSYLLSKFFSERSLGRRMRFAQIVSSEIARRRGLGKNTMTPLYTSDFPRLRDVLSFSPWSGTSAELRN